MDYQDQFHRENIRIFQDANKARFEKMHQQEGEKVKQTNANTSSSFDHRHREEEIAKFIEFQDMEMEEFIAEREILIKDHEEKKITMKKKHWEEEVELEEKRISMKKKHGEEEAELEKEFNTELNRLMEKYTPNRLEEATTVAANGRMV